MVKLIATDLDGTFLTQEGDYDKERFLLILKNLKQQGIDFAVASGRSYLGVEQLFSDTKEELIFIAENGSVVIEKDQVHFEALMPKKQYLQILSRLSEGPFGNESEWLLSGRKGGYVLETASPAYVEHIKRYYANVVLVKDFSEISDDIFKITANLGPEYVLEGAAWLSREIPGVTAMVTGFSSIDVIRDDVDKRTGLEKLCQDLGILPKDVLVFGDNFNDYHMMTFAGTAVATSNAREEIKAIADLVIGSCDQQAVLTYLEEKVCQK